MKNINVHTHIFTINDAPDQFLELFLPKRLADVVTKIAKTPAGSKILPAVISQFGNLGKRYASFLERGVHSDQLDVFHDLSNSYPGEDIKFVSLILDMDHLGNINSNKINTQIQGAITVKKKYPDNVLLFLGLDPRSYNSGNEMLAFVRNNFDTKILNNTVYPFTGLKIYPSTGFYVFDEKLKPTFEWAADNGVPIMSHNNYLGGIFNNDKNTIIQNLKGTDGYTNMSYNGSYITVNKKINIFGMKETNDNMYSCSFFMEPNAYESMFNYFEKRGGNPLKLCFAHYGGLEQFQYANGIGKKNDDPYQKNPVGMTHINWYQQIKTMISQYKGAYTDISYMVADWNYSDNKNELSILTNDLNDQKIQSKIMFGTDFFLAERERAENSTYSQFKNNAQSILLSNGESVWQRMAQSNTSLFLKSFYY